MKSSGRGLIFGGATLVLALAGILVFFEWPGDQTRAGTLGRELRWRAGSFQEYDVAVDSAFEMSTPGSESGQSITVQIEGVLEFRTLESRPSDATVGMRFSVVEVLISGVTDPENNRALTQPFRVRFASNGLPLAFEFPGALSADLRVVIENLVRMFQVAIQNDESWIAQESNASGVYEAMYNRTTPLRVEKTKQRYLKTTSKTDESPPDIVSTESIRLDVDRDWIADMVIEETLTSGELNGPTIVVKNSARLKMRPDSSARASATSDIWRFVAQADSDPSGPGGRPVPGLSREQAEMQLRDGLSKLDAALEGRIVQIHRLRDLLLADGTLSQLLLEAMRENELTDRTRADLYLVLELAGNPEAQAALNSVLTNESWSSRDEMRAIVALGGLEKPTPESLSTLSILASAEPASEKNADLIGTAALALGNLGRGLHGSEDRAYSSIREDLLDGAFRAADPHLRAVNLQALGNTGDPSIRREIAPLLDDGEVEIRVAAAQTLGRLGSSEFAVELMQRFEREDSGRVRGAISEALISWEKPSRAATQSIRTAMQRESDEGARYNMARFLGKNLNAFPENRAALEDLLRFERSQRIRQQVAETLHASP